MINGTVVGHLGRDPEVRYKEDGLVIGNFSVASNRITKDSDATWINCIVFGNKAEVAANYLTQGKMVSVSGEMYTENYEDKNGNKRQSLKMVVNQLELIGSKPDNSNTEKNSDPSEEEIPY